MIRLSVFGFIITSMLLVLYTAYESGDVLSSSIATDDKTTVINEPQVPTPAMAQLSAALPPESPSAKTPQPVAEPFTPAVERSQRVAVTQGRLVPARDAALSFSVSGSVVQIFVDEGDVVEAGQVLVKLDDALQQAQVREVEARLARAEADLEILLAGATKEELDAARAQLERAKAEQAKLEDGTMGGDIAAAEASIASAEAARQKLLEGPNRELIIAAEAELANAEAIRRQAQRAYDQVKWRNDIGMLPESAALELATNAYNAALARLNAAKSGITPADISSANAQVRRYQAELEQVKASLPSQMEAARATVRLFEAQLQAMESGPKPQEIAIAKADVAAAHAALERAQTLQRNMLLVAPFDGTVALLDVDIGEQVQSNHPVVRLAKLDTWLVETEDITDLDIVKINQKSSVLLTFDAVPELEIPGRIQHIRPFAENDGRNTVYTVMIEPLIQDKRFLWNMTVSVVFEPEK
ncbi:HlyD family efflux transporter periplasmic adaptor subunit [Chloroflexi bacterium TSY]|nr:HlyD family efflux transporter periplasmic adaptor subunit [Chloroflexi bacterium TSY]